MEFSPEPGRNDGKVASYPVWELRQASVSAEKAPFGLLPVEGQGLPVAWDLHNGAGNERRTRG